MSPWSVTLLGPDEHDHLEVEVHDGRVHLHVGEPDDQFRQYVELDLAELRRTLDSLDAEDQR